MWAGVQEEQVLFAFLTTTFNQVMDLVGAWWFEVINGKFVFWGAGLESSLRMSLWHVLLLQCLVFIKFVT